MGVVAEPTVRAQDLGLVDIRGEEAAALRTVHPHLGFAVRIGIAREDIGREEVNRLWAMRARDGLDPEVVENIAGLAVGACRLVQPPQSCPDTGG